MLANKNSHFKNYTGDTGADDLPEQVDDLELPVLGEAEYKAHGRALNKPGYSLHLIDTDGTVKSFQYFQLDSGSTYQPGKIKLRFVGIKIVEVEIEGRNLWQLYDHIHSHRMPWIMKAKSDFAQDWEPFIKQFAIIEEQEKIEAP